MVSTVKVTNIDTPDNTGNITFDRPIAGDGSGLTGIAPTKAVVEALGIDVPAANITSGGTLPTLNGSALTNLPLQMEEDYWSFDMASANGTTVHSITASFTPKLAWMTYNPNGALVGMSTGWMNVSGGTAASQNNNQAAGKYWQGNGFIQCSCSGGGQFIDMTASASGQYTITNVKGGVNLSGTGYFSLILFGN